MTAAIDARLRARGLLELVEAICQERRVPRAKVLGRERHKFISTTRKMVYARLLAEGYSSIEVGEMLGRDHTTILTGAKSVRVRVAS